MKHLLAIAMLLVPSTAQAMTPEQEVQVARMRLAGVCQSLVMAGLLETCTVDQLLGVRK